MGNNKEKRDATEAAELRSQAEARLEGKRGKTPSTLAKADAQRLFHELDVHRIELVMQNAELRRARDDAETALEKYADLYDFAPVGYFTLDRTGVIRGVNLTGASLLGIERSRLIGRRLDSLVMPESRPAFSTFIGSVFESRGKGAFEVALSKEKGKRPLHVQIEATATMSGQECRIALVDITERKQLEELQAFMARTYIGTSELTFFQELARYLAMSLGMNFVCIDRLEGDGLNATTLAVWCDGHFEDNVTYALKDTPCGDVVGKTVCCFPASVSQFFPHDQVLRDLRAESYIGVTLWSHTGQPIGLIAVIGRKQLTNTLLAESMLKLVAVRAAGELERLDAEAKIRKSERQLAEAQSITHIGSWEWDALADEITGSNEFNRIFGQSLSSYDSFMELVHPDDREAVNKAVQETLAHQAAYNVHYRIIRPDGITRVIHAQGAAITDGAGKTVRMTGTAKDVTEQREMEKKLEIMHSELASHASELEAANIELEAFNHMVAHDLRTPLANINGFCQVVQKSCAEHNEKCKIYIREIYESTLRMDRLIGTLLRFSHVKHEELRHEKVDLSKMAMEAARELKVSNPERRVTFRFAEGMLANGDAGLFRILLDNLIGNAWKYSSRKEEAIIEFGMTEFDGKPTYFVRDNGVGFDMAYAEKLFIPFQRLPGSHEFKGHGIGLATVQRIISRHDGRVWAESQPGKGATFYFTLAVD